MPAALMILVLIGAGITVRFISEVDSSWRDVIGMRLGWDQNGVGRWGGMMWVWGVIEWNVT